MNLNRQQRILIVVVAGWAAYFVDKAADEGFDEWFFLRMGWLVFWFAVLFFVLTGRRMEKVQGSDIHRGEISDDGTDSEAELGKGDTEEGVCGRVDFELPVVERLAFWVLRNFLLILWLILLGVLVWDGVHKGFDTSFFIKLIAWTLAFGICAVFGPFRAKTRQLTTKPD